MLAGMLSLGSICIGMINQANQLDKHKHRGYHVKIQTEYRNRYLDYDKNLVQQLHPLHVTF